MTPPAYIQNRLYLKQVEQWKKPDFREILPANYNYQNLIIVTTGIVDLQEHQVLYQTHSCGCGPQPTIKGALLAAKVDWQQSMLRSALASGGNTKERELVDQPFFDFMYVARQMSDKGEENLIIQALKHFFGETKKIKLF